MTDRFPRLTAREIIQILERRGFVCSRSSGSHHIYKDQAGRRVTIPVHAKQTLHPKVLQSILRDAKMSTHDLKRELGR